MMRSIWAADGTNYSAHTLDEIKPEHKELVALLDAMDVDGSALRREDGKITAVKTVWATVANYYIYPEGACHL